MDASFLLLAIEKAKQSVAQGGFPAGAILVKDGKIISEGMSIGNKLNDPSSHGEMGAIRNACAALKTSDLSGTVLYASMQPCLMCFGASMWSSIPKIVFACAKDKVAPAYYGGTYQTVRINDDLLKPLALIHFPSLEAEALAVVQEWEKLFSL